MLQSASHGGKSGFPSFAFANVPTGTPWTVECRHSLCEQNGGFPQLFVTDANTTSASLA